MPVLINDAPKGTVIIAPKYSLNVSAQSVLPFRVSFQNIQYPGYGPGNPAPIGVAVIGINNYVF